MVFYTFLVGAHAVGWCLVSQRARKEGLVDLCQFVRAFIFAPFVFALGVMFTIIVWMMVWKVIVPNIGAILIAIAIVFGACAVLGAIGYFVIAPSVKKAYGVALPFSEKICIILYKSAK